MKTKTLKQIVLETVEKTLNEGLVPSLLDVSQVKLEQGGGAIVHGVDRYGEPMVIYLHRQAIKNLQKGLSGQDSNAVDQNS